MAEVSVSMSDVATARRIAELEAKLAEVTVERDHLRLAYDAARAVVLAADRILLITAIRWWTFDEVQGSRKTFSPRRLPACAEIFGTPYQRRRSMSASDTDPGRTRGLRPCGASRDDHCRVRADFAICGARDLRPVRGGRPDARCLGGPASMASHRCGRVDGRPPHCRRGQQPRRARRSITGYSCSGSPSRVAEAVFSSRWRHRASC